MTLPRKEETNIIVSDETKTPMNRDSAITSFIISTEEVGVYRQTKASTGKKNNLVFGYENF